VSYRQPRCTFSGRIVVPDPHTRGPFYRFNVFERQVYFSAFHLSPQNARGYVEPLERHGIVWGTGYAYAFEQMARMMLEQGIARPSRMRAIITTSEKLTPDGRRAIEQAFGCPVYQEYGMIEDAVFACEHADGRLRVSPDAGRFELVERGTGRVIPEGEPGEGTVVGTSFIRRSQLLLRYRVGDLAEWDAEPDATGFEMPILKQIVGRIEEVVIGPDGRRFAQFYGVFTEVKGVRQAQVVQEKIDLLRIKVVPSPEFSEATVAEIRKRIHVRLTDAMQVEIEKVAEIPRTKAGKFQAVVSLLPKELKK
jgi:phenylacetate-CoA ligase